MSAKTEFELPLDEIRAYCKTQPIRRLSLFGSALHGRLRPDSDIDLLVEYDPDAKVGMEFLQNIVELSEIIGREVDLRTPQDLSRYFRDAVCKEARPIYEPVPGE